MKEYGEFRLEAERQNLAYRPNLAEEMRHLLKGIEALGQFPVFRLEHGDPDAEIRRILQRIGEDLEADRIYISEEAADGKVRRTYEWCREGVQPHEKLWYGVPEGKYGPEWFSAFRRGNGYIIRDTKAYAERDAALSKDLCAEGIRSKMAFPLQIQGRYIGFLGFDNPPEKVMGLAAAVFIVAAKLLSIVLLERNYLSRLEAAKRVDPLTGLRSFSSFTAALDRRAETIVSGEEKTAWDVVYFNIADFKIFNMQHSLGEGDDLLRDMAHAMREIVGSEDVTRYMGDHFYALVEHDRAVSVVKALHQRMKDWPGYQIDVHAGIYTLTAEDRRPGVAIDRAKIAGDMARSDFTHYYRYYDAEMETRLTQNDYLTTHLDDAIAQGWVQPYYQPIVQTQTGKISHFEALARWIDPDGGMVLNPADFLPMLEANHLLYKVDTAILRQACQSMAGQLAAGAPCLPVSINLSTLDFEQENLHTLINDIIDQAGVPRQLISFELRESAMGREHIELGQHIRQFHDDGYQVWLDNFGSGYNSLQGLHNYDFDQLKIDMLFLRHHTDKTEEIIDNIIDMAQKMGIGTMAEGVDTQEQYDYLCDRGCRYIQGYYISKPLPGDLTLSLIQEMAAQEGLLLPEQ